MKTNKRSHWKWTLLSAAAAIMLGFNGHQWRDLTRIRGEHRAAQAARDQSQREMEAFENSKQDLKLKGKQIPELFRDVGELIFSSEKHGAKIAAELFSTTNQVVLFENNSHDCAKIRIYLPPDVTATLVVENVAAGPINQTFRVSGNPEPDSLFQIEIQDKGWHSIDRRMASDGEKKVVLVVDGEVKKAIPTVSSNATGSHMSGPISKFIAVPNASDSNIGQSISSNWCLYFDKKNGGREACGFNILGFRIQREP